MNGELPPADSDSNSLKPARITLAHILERNEQQPAAAGFVINAANRAAAMIENAEQRAVSAEERATTAEERATKAEENAMIDPDTGLWTEEKLKHEVWAWAHREDASPETQIAIIYIDMNNLKSINDTHGHAAGDVAIRELAEKLRNIVDYGMRADDFRAISRSNTAGDEFILALPSREETDIREGESREDLRLTLRDKINALISTGYENNYYATGCVIATRSEIVEHGLALYEELADGQMLKNKERMKKGPRSRIGKRLFKSEPPHIAL